MKSFIPYFLLILLFSTGCNPVKRTENMMLGGDYDRAINEALEQLQKGKSKNYSSFTDLLGDSYQKAVERDLDKINYLKSQSNPELFAEIYETYSGLYRRQEKIKPLLPLPEKKFNLNDYTASIEEYRIKTSDYLLEKAKDLMALNEKSAYRKAYEDLSYVENINSNYKDVRSRLDEVAYKGTDYVLVNFISPTHLLIPKGFIEQLQGISAEKLNRKWTVFDLHPRMDFGYDYSLEVNLSHIDVSPDEYYVENTLIEKQIKDGYTQLQDENGRMVKDSLGNPIKVDKYITVRCSYSEHHQFKSLHIGALSRLKDLHTRQELNSFYTESEIFFENVYATIHGDRRALESHHINYINIGPVPFPTNEQMLYDATEQLKDRWVEQMKNLKSFN